MFFCLALGLLPVHGQLSLKSADLVFCPLRKTWINKYVPKPPVKIKEPLADICASDRQKAQFFFEVARKVPLLKFIPNSATAEKLFFDYLEKGKQAFALIVAPENAPENGIAKSNAERQSTGNNFQTNFDKAQTQIFTLPQGARPPTVQIAASSQTNALRDLEKISRRIQPRAPPAFSL